MQKVKKVKPQLNILFFMHPRTYRFQLPKRALKGTCPGCGPRHQKTLSRYVDSQTGEPLPVRYGRCDRQSNCGYHHSPYHRGPSGASYADEQRLPPLPTAWFSLAHQQARAGVARPALERALVRTQGASLEQAERVAKLIYASPTSTPPPSKADMVPPALVHQIPDDVYRTSLGHYGVNRFARHLVHHLGGGVAAHLLARFHIGTSRHWAGACVFWYIDEAGRKRGGQIKVFDESFHTAKYVTGAGDTKSQTSWVHTALINRYRQQQQPLPDWLGQYAQHAQRSPCLFGLPQLQWAGVDQPIALVEAPKTAVVCSAYFPQFIWLAVGALSYLGAGRLAPLRHRRVVLFPDLSLDGSAFRRWSQTAQQLQAGGYSITVSDYLETRAGPQEREAGLDLADYLLGQWRGYPPDWDL